MTSRTTRAFREALERLPASVQKQAHKQYARFRENPAHPSLQFKEVQASHSVWSARVSSQYRALGFRRDDSIVWFWIGSHAEYDHILNRR